MKIHAIRRRLSTNSVRRVEHLADRFDTAPGRLLTPEEIVATASEITGLPLQIAYIPSHPALPSGMLLGYQPDQPVIIGIDRALRGNRLLETLVSAHEVAHILLGDRLLNQPIPLTVLPEQVPDLDPHLLTLLQTRCGGDSPSELRGELFGALLVARSIPPLVPGTPHTGMPGLESSMGGGAL